MKNITVYTNNTCGYCDTLKVELEKNNIKFEDRITSEWEKEWNDVVGLTGMPTTPTVYYEDSYFIPVRDFGNPQQLIEILKNFKKPTFSESKQALERIKTLNYSVNMAFRNLKELVLSSITKVEEKIDKL